MSGQKYKGLVVWHDKESSLPDVYAYVGDTYSEVYDQVMSYVGKDGAVLTRLEIKLVGSE